MSFLTPSLPLTLLIFFIATTAISSVDPSYESCIPQNCGNQTITYPFWIKNKQKSFCGYPGFELDCRNNSYPILQTPQNNYTIQQILYKSQSLRITNTAVMNLNRGCWPPVSNLSLAADKFAVPPNSSDLLLLSNCSSPGYRNISENRIGCGGESGNGDVHAVGDVWE